MIRRIQALEKLRWTEQKNNERLRRGYDQHKMLTKQQQKNETELSTYKI